MVIPPVCLPQMSMWTWSLFLVMKQRHATVDLVRSRLRKAAWMIAWIGKDESQHLVICLSRYVVSASFYLFFLLPMSPGWVLQSALQAPVRVPSSVTTSTSRDMSGSSVWSDSELRARAGASAPRRHFALDSLSSSTWERWLANRSLGELHIMQKILDGWQTRPKKYADVRRFQMSCVCLAACFTSSAQDLI